MKRWLAALIAVVAVVVALASVLGRKDGALAAPSPEVSVVSKENGAVVAAAVGPTAPITLTAFVGDTIQAPIIVWEMISDVYGAQVQLTFEPTILEVQEIRAGLLLQGDHEKNQAGGYFQHVKIDHAKGLALFAISLLKPAVAVHNLVGPQATVTFRCTAVGTSNGSMSIIFAGKDGMLVSTQVQTYSVTCLAKSTPGLPPLPIPSPTATSTPSDAFTAMPAPALEPQQSEICDQIAQALKLFPNNASLMELAAELGCDVVTPTPTPKARRAPPR
ncbi:MAG: hypothetical protein HYU30_00460 [Chloroflexi bacterium]|nr:hypothetical protein [Chloroflexota bacterium]